VNANLNDDSMNLPTPIEPLLLNGEPYHQVFVKRDDLIDPVISGNKWRKLKYHLQAFEQSDKTNISSFGGAYSNHLHALAKLCCERNIPAFAWIRGEELTSASNSTLADINRWGMQIDFISREQYRQRFDNDYLQQLQLEYPDSYIIPEGGYAVEAIDGCREIISELSSEQPFNHIVVAVGSGTTAAGIMIETAIRYPKAKVHGICAVKNGAYLQEQIVQLTEQYLLSSNDKSSKLAALKPENKLRQFTLQTGYHYGGFAKKNAIFKQAIEGWLPLFNIEFDHVYNGKALLAIDNLIQSGQISNKERVLLIHTGGLQGKRV
jgi:1-aminocyclopropane-1-carboxylate deaminase